MSIYNGIKIDNNSILYESTIDQLTDSYISSLIDDKDIYNNHCFTGLIFHISQHIHIDTSNLYDVYILCNQYLKLCYRYKHKPILEHIYILFNITRDIFYSWSNDTKIYQFENGLSFSYATLCQKLHTITYTGRLDGATSGNIADLFLLKAIDGLTENKPKEEPKTTINVRLSLDDIRQKYGIENKTDIDN